MHRILRAAFAPAAYAVLTLAPAATAQNVGSVASADATVTTTGRLAEVTRGTIQLPGSSSVVARDRSAPISLARGGTILLCRTSSLHLTGSPGTLAIGLDRGALEIRTKASPTDAIQTPDMRLIMPAGGPLDLRMRVSTNGDTCIENRGHKAPTLSVSDAFGEATYQIRPGQHLLFEHGSLRAVVDRETTPCGCPPEDPRAVPLAEAILNGNGSKVTPQQAAAANPFPTAQSEGLAPPPPLQPGQPGETHTQVSTTIAFDPTAPRAPEPATIQTPEPATVPAQTAQNKGGPFHALGHFFKRLFVR